MEGHVLVVSDEVQIRDALRPVLQRIGLKVTEVANGKEASKFLAKANGGIDVVVIDTIFPKKGGIDTIMDMRRDFPDIKIIAITGGGKIEGVPCTEVALGIGANRVNGKPFDIDLFLQYVEELLFETADA